MEPYHVVDLDAQHQQRERNNASWDRIRNDNAASVRSEPIHYIFMEDSRFAPLNTEVIVEEVIEVPQPPPPVQSPQNLEELEEEDADVYCMICDTQITQNDVHDEDICKQYLPKAFKCNECPQFFNFERNLKVHKALEHYDKTQFDQNTLCPICGDVDKKAFSRFTVFNAHVRTHFVKDTFVCKKCDVKSKMEFTTEILLNKHIRYEHETPNELSFCPKCQKVFALEDTSAHILLHSTHNNLQQKEDLKKNKKTTSKIKEKKHKCDQCEKAFVRPAELKRHLAIHDKNNTTKWKCAICSKEYKHVTGLNEHKRVAHGTPNMLDCKICGMKFTKIGNLERHIKVVHPLNEEEKKFDCVDCPSSHSTLASLTNHRKRVHNYQSERSTSRKAPLKCDRFICQVCQREFKEPGMLEKHKRFHILLEKRLRRENTKYTCDYCTKTYVLKASLNWHLQTHFEEEQRDYPFCAVCNLHFETQDEFKDHINQHHSVACTFCQQKFTSRHAFEQHICHQSYANKQFVTDTISSYLSHHRTVICRLCKPPQRLVTLKQINEHKSKHQPRKAHLCWTCHRSFRSAHILALHRMTHNNQQSIQCPHCTLIFVNRIDLKQHVRTVHTMDEDTYQCGVYVDRSAAMSAQSFAEYGLENEPSGSIARAQSVIEWNHPPIMQQPIYQEIQDGHVRCQVCQHSYNNIELLCEHWQTNETDGDHSFAVINCPICDSRFRGVSEAANHIRYSHLYQRTRQLSFLRTIEPRAETVSHQISTQISHKTIDKRLHTCTECARNFKKKCDLVRHIRIHTGERPFQCQHCQLSFRLMSTLRSHQFVHSNEPPSQKCGVCEKMFYERKSLVVHMRIHTGETPIKCKFCDECFRTSFLCNRHEKTCANNAAIVANNTFILPQIKNDQINRTITQISTLPAVPLNVSKTSAFAAVRPEMKIMMNYPTFIITKPIDMSNFIVLIQYIQPERDSIRQTKTISMCILRTNREFYSKKKIKSLFHIDTISEIDCNQLQNTEKLTIVLHNNLRLHVNSEKLLEQVLHRRLVKAKIRLGDMSDEMFQILSLDMESFARRCDICEVEFHTKKQSEQHFYSEDHETAQLMFPMTKAQEAIHHLPYAINPNPQEYMPMIQDNNITDYTCKRCGRKFLDMEPLIAHIKIEHDRGDGDGIHPPRPAAHTAPIH